MASLFSLRNSRWIESLCKTRRAYQWAPVAALMTTNASVRSPHGDVSNFPLCRSPACCSPLERDPNSKARKRALFPQGIGDAGHEILRGFQREEGGRLVLIEACVLGDQGPEALDHPPGQPTDRENVDPAADVLGGNLAVGFCQGPLGKEDEDFSGRYALPEQRLEMLGGSGCFADSN